MRSKMFVSALLAVTLVVPTFAYEEIECSSDPVFSANSCNQCFNGKTHSAGDTIGFLSDDWENSTDTDMILYKEIQEDPTLVNLSSATTTWSQIPSSQDFWEYTTEFENIYSEAEDGYILESGKKITWLQSKLGYGYQITENTAAANENIGLLVFPLTAHALLEDGSISEESDIHNECVLFKSGTAEPETPVVTQRLPDTGPAEFAMLAVLAMILAFVVSTHRRKS